MDPIRTASPTSAHNGSAARTKPNSDNAPPPGDFFAVLSGLGAQANGAEEGKLPDGVGGKGRTEHGPESLKVAMFPDGSPFDMDMDESNAPGDVGAMDDPRIAPGDAESVVLANLSGFVGATTGEQGAQRADNADASRADGSSRGVGLLTIGRDNSQSAAAGAEAISTGHAALPGAESSFVGRYGAAGSNVQAPAVGLGDAPGAVSSELAASPSASILEGSWSRGLVAQTARMDSQNTPIANSGMAGSATSPSARPPSSSAVSGKRQLLAQAFEMAGKPGSPTPVHGLAAPSTVIVGQSVPAGSPPAEVQKTGQDGRFSAQDALGSLSSVPVSASAGVWPGDQRRERVEQRTTERPSSGSAALSQAWAHSGGGPALEAGMAASDGAAPSHEEAVAEQVTYWLSENLKNAELTVEHAGQPVEVRVSLAGNEAHVAFKSDQSQTRELLTARLDQLRELLQDQGLMLSGATVDTSAGGQSGGSSGKSAPRGSRTQGVLAGSEAPIRSPQRTLASGTVDLYV